jgi:hypothetical protein
MKDAQLEAQKQAGLDASEAATLPPIVGALPGSRIMREAQRGQQHEVLASWAAHWDGVQPQIQSAADTYGKLQLLRSQGVDWQHPDAHQADFSGGPGRRGLDSYTSPSIEGAHTRVREADKFDELDLKVEAAEDGFAASVANVKASQSALRACIELRHVAGLQRQKDKLTRDAEKVTQLVDVLLGAAAIAMNARVKASASRAERVRDGLQTAHGVGAAKVVTQLLFQPEVDRLSKAISRAEDAAQQAGFDKLLDGLKRAVLNSGKAHKRLKAARAAAQQARGTQAQALRSLGTKIDDHRAETGDTPQRGPIWATQLLSAAGFVGELQFAFSKIGETLTDQSGPVLVAAIIGRLENPAAAALDPEVVRPGEADLAIAQAAGQHWAMLDVLREQGPAVEEAHSGWTVLKSKLKGGR